MPWIFVDLVLGTAALVGLGVVVLGVWRRVKDLGREVTAASAAIGAATQSLESAQQPPRRR